MKSFYIPFVFTFILGAAITLADFRFITILACICFSVLFFNILVRKSLNMKSYFLSDFNIFSAKVKKQFEVEIPANLAFHKVEEVIANSGLKLITKNDTTFEMLAIAKTSWKSWGENIYISLTESQGKTIVNFTSAALFQMFTWGKNEANYSYFFKKLEDSFII